MMDDEATRPANELTAFALLRAMAISCALMPLMAWWVVQGEMVWDSAYPTTISLFFHVTFVVFVLALVNLGVRRRWPRLALAPAEILMIYVMLSVAATFCSHDLLQILVPMIAFPEYAANPLNRWDERLLTYIPDWAIVANPRTLTEVAVGNSTLYAPDNLAAWARPLAFWLVFTLALVGALMCINLFFRHQWTEKERLSFPVIHIPVALATGLEELLRNRLFWIAFGVTAVVHFINGLNFFYPSLPSIPTTHVMEFRDYFVEPPWSAIRHTFVNLCPFAIGLAFFIPTDLAFSCWFFFVFYKLQTVGAAQLGVRELPGFPFTNQQAAGGYIALGLWAIWLSRRHLWAVARRILGRPGGADESHEPFSYRTTFIVFVLCSCFLIGSGMAMGAQPHVMAIFFLIFFLYSLAIARMRAELGPPAHDLHAMGPDALIVSAVGDKGLTNQDLGAFTMFYWFNRAYRAHFSAHSIEGLKIAQLTRTTARAMTFAILLASVVGAVAALWATTHALHVHGYSGRISGDAFSREAWYRMDSWVAFPQRPRIAPTVATGLGLVAALGMGLLRMRLTWWPFHPVGYAVSSSWSLENLWACIFIAWLAKVLITRYGGAAAYRRAIPFFIGMVLGDFTMGSLWSIYSAVVGTKVYPFWGL